MSFSSSPGRRGKETGKLMSSTPTRVSVTSAAVSLSAIAWSGLGEGGGGARGESQQLQQAPQAATVPHCTHRPRWHWPARPTLADQCRPAAASRSERRQRGAARPTARRRGGAAARRRCSIAQRSPTCTAVARSWDQQPNEKCVCTWEVCACQRACAKGV